MDGRKYTVMYFGRFNNEKMSVFYNDVLNHMKNDGIDVTHLVCGKTGQSSWNIRKTKYVKKRYEETLENKPEEILSMSVMNIENTAAFPPNDYLFDCSFTYKTRTEGKHNKNKYYNCYCCDMSVDLSVVDRLSIEEYRNILRATSNWYKEVIFECGVGDVPMKYAMFQKPIISKTSN